MTVTAEWEDESRTIIHVRFQHHWTMDEFFETCEETVLPMFESIDHTAHIMVEFDSRHVPRRILTRFHQLADIPQFTHPNSGILVVWGGPRIVESFGNMFIRVFGQQKKMLMVRDEAEARAKLAAHDETSESSS